MSIEERIEEFDRNMQIYWEVLSDKAVWLFLASMSVWSITNYNIKIFALLVIIIFYICSLLEAIKERSARIVNFDFENMKIKRAIEREVPSDEQPIYLAKLEAIDKKRAIVSIIKMGGFWMFSLSFLFYGVTCFYMIVDLSN